MISGDPQVLGDYLAEARPASAAQRAWTPDDGALPALYLAHGAPPLLDDPVWLRELGDWARSMPKPRSVLVVSAHWEEAPLSISSTRAGTPLVYDFGGFAQRYYEMTYATPDASDLGRAVAAVLPDGTGLHESPSRGLDHGAWVPMTAMYPLGDVPVVQLSMPTQDPESLLEIGRRLAPLREEGVLVVGSGFLTHGLPFLRREHFAGMGAAPVPGWSSDFDAWAGEALAKGDVDALSRYTSLAPGMPYAHPTVEHYTPMFVALGASGQPDHPVDVTVEGWWMGLSKRSFSAGSPPRAAA